MNRRAEVSVGCEQFANRLILGEIGAQIAQNRAVGAIGNLNDFAGQLPDGARNDLGLQRSESEISDFPRGFEGAARRASARRQKSYAHGARAFGQGVAAELFFESAIRNRKRIAADDRELAVVCDVADDIVTELPDCGQSAFEHGGIEAKPPPSHVFVDAYRRFEKSPHDAPLRFRCIGPIVGRSRKCRHAKSP